MKRTVPVVASVAAALLAAGAVLLWRAREARAGAEPARRLLAEIAPDLAAARDWHARLARAHVDAISRPAQGEPAGFFGDARPASSEASSRPVAGTGLELRTTTLSWPSAPPEALSRGIAAAEADGHRLASAEIDPARPAGRVRATLVFETLVPSEPNTP